MTPNTLFKFFRHLSYCMVLNPKPLHPKSHSCGVGKDQMKVEGVGCVVRACFRMLGGVGSVRKAFRVYSSQENPERNPKPYQPQALIEPGNPN